MSEFTSCVQHCWVGRKTNSPSLNDHMSLDAKAIILAGVLFSIVDIFKYV